MISKQTVQLSTLCLSLALFACNYRQAKKGLENRSTIGSSSSHSWIIQYGWDNMGTLKYVAFTGAKKPAKFKAIVVVGSDETYLVNPNGYKVKLPSNYQMYEFVDGKFRQSKGDVTLVEIEEFVNSNPNSYNIDSLLGFVKERRSGKRCQEPF